MQQNIQLSIMQQISCDNKIHKDTFDTVTKVLWSVYEELMYVSVYMCV